MLYGKKVIWSSCKSKMLKLILKKQAKTSNCNCCVIFSKKIHTMSYSQFSKLINHKLMVCISRKLIIKLFFFSIYSANIDQFDECFDRFGMNYSKKIYLIKILKNLQIFTRYFGNYSHCKYFQIILVRS